MKHKNLSFLAVVLSLAAMFATTACKRNTAGSSGVEDISAHRPSEPEMDINAPSGTHTGNTQHGFEREKDPNPMQRIDQEAGAAPKTESKAEPQPKNSSK